MHAKTLLFKADFGPKKRSPRPLVKCKKNTVGECLPGARPARYFFINYPDFSPTFTLPWRSPPSRPHCTAHLPYKARCKIKQDLCIQPLQLSFVV